MIEYFVNATVIIGDVMALAGLISFIISNVFYHRGNKVWGRRLNTICDVCIDITFLLVLIIVIGSVIMSNVQRYSQ